jgi:hypothetical protein
MVAVTKNKKGDEILKIFISETTGPIGTKLCLDSPWMTPFQNCVEMKIFKISSPFLFLVTATMLVGGRDYRTQFWKGITYGPFHQSLVSSGQVVSEENIFSNLSDSLFNCIICRKVLFSIYYVIFR